MDHSQEGAFPQLDLGPPMREDVSETWPVAPWPWAHGRQRFADVCASKHTAQTQPRWRAQWL